MFKHLYEQIDNVELYPIISLIIFFVFFVGLGIYIFFVDKSYINKMKNIPFEEEETSKLNENEVS